MENFARSNRFLHCNRGFPMNKIIMIEEAGLKNSYTWTLSWIEVSKNSWSW
jgi:hypothetical protein